MPSIKKVRHLLVLAPLVVMVNSAAAESVTCPGAYVHISGHEAVVPLVSAPDDSAKPVMQLNDMQYVCIAQEKTRNGKAWSKVVVVPMLKGNAPFEVSVDGKPRKVDNYSAKVKHLQKEGRCSLTTKDDGVMVHFRAQGQCPAGWVPTAHVHATAE